MGTLRKLLAMYGLDPSRTINDIHKKKLYSIMAIGHKCVVLDLVLQRSEDMGEDLLEKDQKKQVGSASWTTRQKKTSCKTHRESKDTFNAQRYLYHNFS